MGEVSNDEILTWGLAGLAVYFSVLLVRGFVGYQRFRRVRPTALLTWPNCALWRACRGLAPCAARREESFAAPC